MPVKTIPLYPKPHQKTLHLTLPHQPLSIPQPNPLHTYLNIHPIIPPPQITPSNPIHPPYPFLSHTTTFPQKLQQNHIHFIPPNKKTIQIIPHKITPPQTLHSPPLPLIPPSTHPLNSLQQIKQLPKHIRYPLLLKPPTAPPPKPIPILKQQNQLQKSLKQAKTQR
ncbi:biotin carboxylase N-terminal domain-containing protein, partial [Staphylococcus hominis]|uniref:biotin carboxylase N-terminal domain-containing protein n=1 Tax=Staphylococcus hominis TaxID=1290 RepID=UPI003709AF3D